MVERIASVLCYFASKEVRAGNIIFGIGLSEELDYSYPEGTGFEFYAKARETEYGLTYGGYVNAAKLHKEDRHEGQYYLNINPYKGDKEDIVYLLRLTEIADGEFGEVVASGLLYSSVVKGLTRGYLFAVDVEEVEKRKKMSSENGSAKKPTSSKRKSLSEDEDEAIAPRRSAKAKSGRTSSRNKKTEALDDDTPY